MKFVLKLLLLFVLSFTLLTPIAFAEREGVGTLVALGDSITFGYNLDPKNLQPSNQSFPALIAKEKHYQVRNLGIPGATSADLLAQLTKKEYRKALKNADLITLDIGSNDLLEGAKSIIDKLKTNPNYNPDVKDYELLDKITKIFGSNLSQIIIQIRQLTDVPIVLYNIYNPFYGADEKTAGMLMGINGIIYSYKSDPFIAVADAFSAYAGKQILFVLPYEIHPTLQGQRVLADLGIDAINKFPQPQQDDRRGDRQDRGNDQEDRE